MIHLTKKDGKFDEEGAKQMRLLPDGNYVVDKKKNKRSLDQNNGLWRWDTILSEESGYLVSEIHYIMLGRIFGSKEIKIGNTTITKPNKTSSELSTVEFSHYIEIYPAVAFELFNVTLPPFSYEETTKTNN